MYWTYQVDTQTYVQNTRNRHSNSSGTRASACETGTRWKQAFERRRASCRNFFNYSPYNYSVRRAREKKNKPRRAKFNSADWHARRPARPANWIFSLVVPLISVVSSATRVTNARANKKKKAERRKLGNVHARQKQSVKNRLESFGRSRWTDQPAARRESGSSRWIAIAALESASFNLHRGKVLRIYPISAVAPPCHRTLAEGQPRAAA